MLNWNRLLLLLLCFVRSLPIRIYLKKKATQWWLLAGKLLLNLTFFLFPRSKEMLNICTFHRNDQRFVPSWFGSWISERFSSIWFHSKMINYILNNPKERRNNQIKWVHRWYKNKHLKIESKWTSYTKVCLKKRKAERMPFKWNALNNQLEWWPKNAFDFRPNLCIPFDLTCFIISWNQMTKFWREEKMRTNGQWTKRKQPSKSHVKYEYKNGPFA